MAMIEQPMIAARMSCQFRFVGDVRSDAAPARDSAPHRPVIATATNGSRLNVPDGP
jgi:hypothetical protein